MTRETSRRAVLGAVGATLFGGTAYAVVRTTGRSDREATTATRRASADAESPRPTATPHPTETAGTTAVDPSASDPPETALTPTALPGLEPVEADESVAYDLDDGRTVVGSSRLVTPAEETFRAVRWPDEETVEDLGTLLDDDDRGASQARAIDGCGTVVGFADAAGEDGDRRRRAVRWTDDELEDLGTLGGPSSEAFGINDDGTVVGAADTDGGERHAFRWTEDEGMRDLGTLRAGNAGDSVARAVTEDGRIVGESDVDGRVCAFTWTEDEGMRDLGMLEEGDGSTANDAVGAATVGASFTPGDRRLTRRAVRFADGETSDLGALEPSAPDDPTYAEALGLNDDGVAVGLSEFTPPERFEFSLRFRAVRFVDDRVEPLGILGETNTGPSAAEAVNTHGTVVGSDRNEGVIRAVVWTEG